MKAKLLMIILLTQMLSFLFLNHSLANKNEDLYIKIDLWTKKLFVIANEKEIKQYSISIGTELTPTPIGTFTVINKSKSWGGGFGSRWLGLNVPWGMYGIHGTNRPHLIGEDISSGCIRLRNADVEELYELIPEGTNVYIEGPITGNGKGEYKNLSIGSKGNLVQLVQGRLKALGYYDGKVDGIFGAETDWAVRKFQKANDVYVNGGISITEYHLLGIMD